MFETLLNELRASEGVIGAIIFTERSQLLYQSVPHIYQTYMPKLVHAFLSSCAAMGAQFYKSNPFECCFMFVEGSFFVRRVNELYLGLICSASADPSFVCMTMNMTANRIKKSHARQQSAPPNANRTRQKAPKQPFGVHLSTILREELGDGILQLFVEHTRRIGVSINDLSQQDAIHILPYIKQQCEPIYWSRFDLRFRKLLEYQ